MNKRDALIDWVQAKVGCGYVYGATGWICSEKQLAIQAEQYPERAKTITTVCRKWIGKECYDCAQLVRQALKTIGVSIPSGATSQWQADVWAQKGEIAQMPDTLCALYRQSVGVMAHAGWHIGGGVTIDARSSASGVIRSTTDKYPWTHWAIPKGLPVNGGKDEEAMDALYYAEVATEKDPLRVRDYPATGEILGHVPKGATVEVLEELDNGWAKVRYNELEGWASVLYLERVEDGAQNDVLIEENVGSIAADMTIIDSAGNRFKPVGDWRVLVGSVDSIKLSGGQSID